MTREVRGRSVDDRQSVVGNGKRSAMRDVHRRRLRILVSNDQQPRRCGRCRRCIASATAHAKCTPAAHRSESSAVPRRILGHVDHPISSVDCGLSHCVLAPGPQSVPKNIRDRKQKTWDLRALATMRPPGFARTGRHRRLHFVHTLVLGMQPRVGRLDLSVGL